LTTRDEVIIIMHFFSLAGGCNYANQMMYLLSNRNVIVITLYFSKAFNTVWHHTLLNRMAESEIPDHIYNWLTDFFTEHSHQTHYGGSVSQIQCISACIIQGSAYMYNVLCKYADNTYPLYTSVFSFSTRKTHHDILTKFIWTADLFIVTDVVVW